MLLTYVPTLNADISRIMIKIANINRWKIYQLDIFSIFLNENIYMKIPYFGEGYK